MSEPESVRFAPRDNPRRKNSRKASAVDTATLRRSSRHQNERAYFHDRPPATVVPGEAVSSLVRHPVSYLEGQEDIPRSDDEEGNVLGSSNQLCQPPILVAEPGSDTEFTPVQECVSGTQVGLAPWPNPTFITDNLNISTSSTGTSTPPSAFGLNPCLASPTAFHTCFSNGAGVLPNARNPCSSVPMPQTPSAVPPATIPLHPQIAQSLQPMLSQIPMPGQNSVRIQDAILPISHADVEMRSDSPPLTTVHQQLHAQPLTPMAHTSIPTATPQPLVLPLPAAPNSPPIPAQSVIGLAGRVSFEHLRGPNPDAAPFSHAVDLLASRLEAVRSPSNEGLGPVRTGRQFSRQASSSSWLIGPEQRQQRLLRMSHLSLGANAMGPSAANAREYRANWYMHNRPRIARPKPLPVAGSPGRSRSYQGNFTVNEQTIMFAVKHSVLYDLICVEPFPPSIDAMMPRAIVHAETVMRGKLASGESSQMFGDHVFKKCPRKRWDLLRIVTPIIKQSYNIPMDPPMDDNSYQTVNNLINHDSFIEKDSIDPGEFAEFRHPAIFEVLKALFFRTRPQLGLIFIERLCADDEDALWHRKRADQSPEAKKGMPLAAIAFACLVIIHVLNNHKLQTMGEPVVEFEAREYGSVWGRFYRKLAAFPNLGRLRKELLDLLKIE